MEGGAKNALGQRARALSPGRARRSRRGEMEDAAEGQEEDADAAGLQPRQADDAACPSLHRDNGDHDSKDNGNGVGRPDVRAGDARGARVEKEGVTGVSGKLASRADGWQKWALALAMVWLQLINNYDTQDQSSNYAMEHLTRTAIETLPPNAIVLCSGDLQFNPGLYLTACEGVRPDVAFISLQLMSYRWYALNKTIKYPDVVFPGRSHWPDEHGFSLQKFFEANILNRPIHVYGGENSWTII